MTAFALGLDLGTSSAKVSALDLEGRFLGQASADYRTHVPHAGWSEQNADDWLPAIARATRRLLTEASLRGQDAVALAISTAAHIGVLLDEGFRPLRPALLWSDQRSAREAAALGEQHGEEILRRGLNWPTTTWTLPHLAWIRKNDPDTWAKTRHVLLSKDYLTFQLTGQRVTDPATAVSALLYDPGEENWSDWLCELGGITPDMLPDVRPIGAEIGPLSPITAEMLGLSRRTRVFNGTLDSTAETFSAGVIDDTACVLRLASAGGLHLLSRGPRPEARLLSYPFPVEPFWLSQAGTNSCATAVSWAASLFGQGGEVDFTRWDKRAAYAPAGADGVLFHPYLAGERCPYWDPALRASFTGLALGHGASHFARAVYEGTAFSLRDAAGVFGERAAALRELRLVGGGARSPLWCAIVSAVFDRPAVPVAEADSSVGAAMIALGEDFTRVAAMRDAQRGASKPVLPNPAWRDAYASAFERYLRVQRQISAIHQEEARL